MQMVEPFDITGFKSIKDLRLRCARVNVFIGEPNVGKSNILEAIGLLSWGFYAELGYSAQSFCRFERTSNFFYDENLQTPLRIRLGSLTLDVKYEHGTYHGTFADGGGFLAEFSGDHQGIRIVSHDRTDRLRDLKYYRFGVRSTFPSPASDFLLPPSGDNLLSLLAANSELRTLVNEAFKSRGFRIGLRQHEHKIELVKQFEDIIISYPYSLVSETLQRLTFYQAAVFTNKESIITFEEPEAHAFPFYTKVLAEMIALDENKNQYFISTHNPYFLMPLLAKAPMTDVAVHVVYYQDYQTKVKTLSEAEMTELTELDVFSNLDRFIPGR